MIKPIFLAAAFLFLTAEKCEGDADSQQRHEQERINKQGNAAVGMPAIVNYQEKRILKMIYELRDNDKLATHTYIVDFNGNLHKICNSIGYGVPAATQFTNPQKYEMNGATLPQADPNGLFSPSSAEGTWVLCFNPQTKKTSPTYMEPRIIVSTFPLVAEGNKN